MKKILFILLYLGIFLNSTFLLAQPLPQIIVPDFFVDDMSDRINNPSIALDDNGNFVVTWQSEHSRVGWGNSLSNIYAQRCSNNGNFLGQKFMINDVLDTAITNGLNIAMSSNGNFVITWKQITGSISAQRFLSDGTPIGNYFKVNDSLNRGEDPSISMNSTGDFVITWTVIGYSINQEGDIYAQRYANDGTAIGNNFKVTIESSDSTQTNSSVAMADNGNFIITWMQNPYGWPDIYAQIYANDGTRIGSNIKINDDLGSEQHSDPCISADASGNFVVTWTDTRNAYRDIYAQRFLNNGLPIGTNFRINDDQGSANQSGHCISMNNIGEFVIAWTDDRNGVENIYAQRFAIDGSAIGSNFNVDSGFDGAWLPAVSINSTGNFVITWMDYRDSLNTVYAQIYNNDGTTVGNNLRISNRREITNQSLSSITVDASENFIISWQDDRHGYPEIYTQYCTNDGKKSGINIKVNDDQGNALHENPYIAVNASGKFVITWQDTRNGIYDIYAQQYSADKSPLGINYKINDDTDNAIQLSPSICIDDAGNFVIAWEDGRNGLDIYAQRFSSDGNAMGTNFKVNDDPGLNLRYSPDICTSGNGDFVIVWEDGRNGYLDIYAQRYESNGDTLGINLKVNDDQVSTNHKFSPSISVNDIGNFVIAWEDGRNGDTDIYAQRYSSYGNAIGSNFQVNENQGTADQHYPSVSLDSDGNFVISWSDQCDGAYKIFGQRYLNFGTPAGSNFLLAEDRENPQIEPSVKLMHGKIFNSWTELDESFDVWANVWLWPSVAGISTSENTQPSDIFLGQNYPNPFNPSTIIEFSIPKTEYVILKIYNLLGQEVATLVSDKLTPGSYNYSWDASGFASGVYFYKIEAGEYEKTKKLILLK